MKFALFYETADLERAPSNQAAHRAHYRAFAEEGTLLLIGPFADRSGALGIFSTREAAESFAAADPFVLNGVVGRWEVREWDEVLSEP
jgi:hypothetical protein